MKKHIIILLSLCPFFMDAQNIIGLGKADLVEYINNKQLSVINEGYIKDKDIRKNIYGLTDSIYAINIEKIKLIYYFDKWSTCKRVDFILEDNTVGIGMYYMTEIFKRAENIRLTQPPFFLYVRDTNDYLYFNVNMDNRLVFMTEDLFTKYINNYGKDNSRSINK